MKTWLESADPLVGRLAIVPRSLQNTPPAEEIAQHKHNVRSQKDESKSNKDKHAQLCTILFHFYRLNLAGNQQISAR